MFHTYINLWYTYEIFVVRFDKKSNSVQGCDARNDENSNSADDLNKQGVTCSTFLTKKRSNFEKYFCLFESKNYFCVPLKQNLNF